MRRVVPALVLALTFAASLLGQSQAPPPTSIDGNWSFVMDSQMGQVSARVTMKTTGDEVTGSMTLDDGRVWPIEKGVLKGQELSFLLTRQRPTGGSMIYNMAGKVSGDSITGVATADMDGQTLELPWSMKRLK